MKGAQKIYLSHNMFNKGADGPLKLRSNASDRLERLGFKCLWLYDKNDFKRDLTPDEIVGRCYGILSVSDILVVLDAEEPGWGKNFEIAYASKHNIKIYSIWRNSGQINQWIEYYSDEIFSSLDSLIEYLKV